MRKIKSRNKGTIIGVFFILMAVMSFTPILNTSLLFFIVALVSIIALAVNIDSVSFRRNNDLIRYVLAYISLCIVYKILGVSSVSYGSLFIHFFFFVPILFMLLVRDSITDGFKQKVFWVVIFVVLFNVVDNIRLCLLHPELMFIISRNKEEMTSGMNVGGNQFFVAVLFFTIVCLFGFLNSKKKINKHLLLVTIIISLIFNLFFCLKAGIIVYTIFFVILMLLARRAKNIRRFVIRIVVPFLFVSLIVNIYTEYIIDTISNIVNSPRLSQRLIFLIDADSASAESGANTIEARENLWFLSLRTWLDNPINFLFGIGDHRVDWDGGQTAAQVGIGNHSDFFDTPARYGLIGVILIYLILKKSIKYLLSYFDKDKKIEILVIILLFIMFGFTYGGFRPPIGFVLYMFLPLMKPLLRKNVK